MNLPRLRFELRTFCLQDRCCLPVELSRRIKIWSGQQDSNLRTLVSKTSPYSHCGTPGENENLASGQGFEPRSTGSEPGILPVRRTRNDLAGKAGLEPARASLKYWMLDALHSSPYFENWRRRKDSNLQPPRSKRGALSSVELRPRVVSEFFGGDGEIRTLSLNSASVPLCQFELHPHCDLRYQI